MNRANCKFVFEKASYDDPSEHYYVPEFGDDGPVVPNHPKPVAVWCSVVAKRDIFYGEGCHIDYAVDPINDGGTPVTNDESATSQSQSDPSQAHLSTLDQGAKAKTGTEA